VGRGHKDALSARTACRFAVIATLFVACSGRPSPDPAVHDNQGILAGWRAISSIEVVNQPLGDPRDVTVEFTGDRVFQVAWQSFMCQREPVLVVETEGEASVEIHLWRGELPDEGCEAMGTIRGFELEAASPISREQIELVDHGD
jgi:hypothetical protein